MKEEVDLLEVPLVEVISVYLEDMEAAGVIGYWDDMTEFLLLMSLLVEVKSRMLLPEAFAELEEEITPEEARDQLLARLFVYSQFKAASARLRELGLDGCRSAFRLPLAQATIKLPSLDEIRASADPAELRECIMRIAESRREPDASHLPQLKIELRRQIAHIRKLLDREERFSFDKVFGDEEPLVQALSVFALLDLLSRGEIRVEQSRAFGDILVKRAVTKSRTG